MSTIKHSDDEIEDKIKKLELLLFKVNEEPSKYANEAAILASSIVSIKIENIIDSDMPLEEKERRSREIYRSFKYFLNAYGEYISSETISKIRKNLEESIQNYINKIEKNQI